ncbi:MAG: hypothetical protein OET90_06830 [Desulfuromonadales bacterium]|nr:hypothetical protein [Desulfuromonadales bacterium]
MATVTKKGIGPWRKTVVEHAGKTETFSGSAKVTEQNGAVCVTESGIFKSKEVCYLDKSAPSKGSALPDGQLVGKSKSISVELNNGEKRVYDSSITSINSMEKSGENVKVVKNGVFGSKVVDTIKANDIANIQSEDCNVCKSMNPIYKD